MGIRKWRLWDWLEDADRRRIDPTLPAPPPERRSLMWWRLVIAAAGTSVMSVLMPLTGVAAIRDGDIALGVFFLLCGGATAFTAWAIWTRL